MKHNNVFALSSSFGKFVSEGEILASPTISIIEETQSLLTLPKLECYEETIPFYIESLEDGNKISAKTYDNNKRPYYSLDGNTWTLFPLNLSGGSNIATITLNKGERIYFKAGNLQIGNEDTFADGEYGCCDFYTTLTCNIGGNIMSVLCGDLFICKYDYDGLEKNCYENNIEVLKAGTPMFFPQNTKDISKLVIPIKDMTNISFTNMFYGLNYIEQGPIFLCETNFNGSGLFASYTVKKYDEFKYLKLNVIEFSESYGEVSNMLYSVADVGTLVLRKELEGKIDEAKFRSMTMMPEGWTIVYE